MERDTLVRMANQIAFFFEPYPEGDAVAGVRDHIEKFWDPAMRRELMAIDAVQPAEHATLHPLVHKCIAGLRQHSTE